jgi:aminoglycoside phosphotransferase family enzyme
MHAAAIAEKVMFLRCPEAYPEGTSRVEVNETHLSWVFLTDRYAYKLKKPVRCDFVDYSTLESRRVTCDDEVRLNRRLAASVYIGVVPLTVLADGRLSLGEPGEICDWLVKMHRLPADRMLDRVLAAGTLTVEDASRVGELLAAFYRTAPVVTMAGSDRRRNLAQEIHLNRQELARPEYHLQVDVVEHVAAAELAFLDNNSTVFDARVEAGRIVEAHGDLRPEHICLEGPVIIDCLEFSCALRTLDVASELAFLWLECERLGASEVGRTVFDKYCELSGDRPPASLVDFYKGWHACTRARIAVWHLRDHVVTHPDKWIERARHYLRLAATHLPN